jgi:hypothetical protein
MRRAQLKTFTTEEAAMSDGAKPVTSVEFALWLAKRAESFGHLGPTPAQWNEIRRELARVAALALANQR